MLISCPACCESFNQHIQPNYKTFFFNVKLAATHGFCLLPDLNKNKPIKFK